MDRLIKFSWFLTTILFLVVLLWVYAYLPESVNLGADAAFVAEYHMSRESFFYSLLLLFVFINAVLFTLRKLIGNSLGKNPVREFSGRRVLQEDLAIWLLGFAGSLNIFLILVMVFLSFFNTPEGIGEGYFVPLVYTGPVLIGFLLIFLVYILLKKRA